MTTSTVAPQIVRFAEGVRAALADLPAEEVDDLTEGLEADLAESLAEDLRRTLPDPVAYAAELRLAAGLPARAPSTKGGLLRGLPDAWQQTREAVDIAVRRTPVLAGAVDLAGSLRPVWWIVRAWLATWLLAAFFGMEDGYWFEGVWWLVLVWLVVVSAQWGRGRWSFPGLSAVLVIGNVVAVAALVPVLSAVDARSTDTVYVEGGYGEPDLTGVYLNGVPVTNIFGFDADGKPLREVQLFDQDGNPLATAVSGADGCLDADCEKTGLWVPSALRNGTVAWNVFPMRMVEDEMDVNGGLRAVPGAEPQDRVSPYKRVPALVTTEKVAKPND